MRTVMSGPTKPEQVQRKQPRRVFHSWLPPSSDSGATSDGHQSAGPRVEAEVEGGEELDAMLAEYERAAAADKQAAEEAAAGCPSSNAPKTMVQARDDGLAQPLPSDNRGFALLSKMGYQPGSGLGKHASGQTTPLPLLPKSARSGLGIDEAKRRQVELRREQQQLRGVKRARVDKQWQVAFKQQQSTRLADRHAAELLTSARQVCQTLDERAGLEASIMWPCQVNTDDNIEPDNDWEATSAQDRLEDVVLYLRERHYYCVYCGCQYDDASDLARSCPGREEEQH
ncbi:hypothetical protein WJX72_004951 [[Myrmecia] bisecta]|uniref:G-patch domain-containing protein n=1 Tax=[Myrmecia] bisecta TaxID=41462 RepID=A0AAW1R6D4_9CHLO